MRKLLIGTALIFLIPLGAWAQQEFPKVEVFGGYSYLKLSPEEDTLNGWNASVTGNITRWFGVEGDFSGHYGNPKLNGQAIPGFSIDSHTFMGGPKITARISHFAPFAHFLIGVNRAAVKFNGSVVSDIALAAAVGGGLDINISNHFAIRAFQADYLMTRFDTGSIAADRENNFRVSAGIVFKFGNH
jgi:hypothetical protein